MSEKNEQASVVSWFGFQYKPWKIIAVTNEQKFNDPTKNVFAIAASQKKQGVVAGTSDLFIAKPSGGYHGMWLEMKDVNKTYEAVTDNQRQFIKDMLYAGYYADWAAGFDIAQKIINDYMHCLIEEKA